jgi:hypothetical protein
MPSPRDRNALHLVHNGGPFPEAMQSFRLELQPRDITTYTFDPIPVP